MSISKGMKSTLMLCDLLRSGGVELPERSKSELYILLELSSEELLKDIETCYEAIKEQLISHYRGQKEIMALIEKLKLNDT